MSCDKELSVFQSMAYRVQKYRPSHKDSEFRKVLASCEVVTLGRLQTEFVIASSVASVWLGKVHNENGGNKMSNVCYRPTDAV
jgi:hypothetical protein